VRKSNDLEVLKQNVLKIISQEIPSNKIYSILLCGSFSDTYIDLYSDIDIICIVDPNYLHRRYFILNHKEKHQIEVEFISSSILELYLTHYWWWPHNWDIEMGKYFYGQILMDKNNTLQTFKFKLKDYPEDIRAFLVLHRLGRLLNLKCKYLITKSKYLLMELIKTYIFLLYPIEKTYPKSADIGENFHEELRILMAMLGTHKEPKIPAYIVDRIDQKISSTLLKDNQFCKTFKSIPLRFPDEVRGKYYLMKLQEDDFGDITLKLEFIWGDTDE